MNNRFSISVALLISVSLLTVALFVLVVIDVNNTRANFAPSATPISNAPLQPLIDYPGQKIFKANCSPCHRINEKLIGPPLAGVLERRDSLWVIKMIRNSSQLIASGDPTAVELFREYNSTQMTSFTSLSDEQLRNLLEYIKLESDNPQPVPAPSRVKV